MRSSLIAPVFMTIAAFAQQDMKVMPKTAPPAGKADAPHAALVRRLDSITWNPVTAELSWVVSTWDSLELGGQPQAKATYSMSIDSATMKFNGEDRHFDPVEAKHVRSLMDLLSVYAVESTVWWDQGKGEKVTSPGPAPGNKDAAPKKDDETPSKPLPKTAPSSLRGGLRAERTMVKTEHCGGR